MGYWDREHEKQAEYAKARDKARRGHQVGDTIRFARYGDVPSHHSCNHRDGTAEEGVSVYLIDQEEEVHVGWYFGIINRERHTGTGRIVGWGSDDEPLVEVIQIDSRAQ